MRNPFDGNYPITQTFGNDLILNGVHYYAKYGYKGHNGIDYGLPTGTNVLAPHSGTVKEAYFDATGYGWYIKIENEIEGSVLGHMLSLNVKVGDVVSEGQLISISDNTGGSTGPHLHWGYYRFPRDRNNGYGGFINQIPYINTTPSPIPNPQPSEEDISIRDFLITKGYTYPEAHLEVIKAMYESDWKLKSGQLILKIDCDKEKKILEEAFDTKESKWKEAKQEAIENAVLETEKIINAKWEKQVQDYVQVKNSSEYKLALFLYKLLHLNKGGES